MIPNKKHDDFILEYAYVEDYYECEPPKEQKEPETKRGVIIIDLFDDEKENT